MISLYIKHKKYNSFELADIPINIKPGTINLLLGHNGAGKTTIIKSLFGLTEFEGDLNLNNRKISFESLEDVDFFKSQIAYLPDNISLLDYLTPTEYFQLIKYTSDSVTSDTYLNHLIQIFNLDKYLNVPIRNLSHGNKKKTQIVSQLSRKTNFMVFDEPTNGLDPDMIITLKRVLEKLKAQGVGVLISTHDLNFGKGIFDNIIILRDGSIKLNNTKEEVKSKFGNILLEDLYTQVNKDYYKYIEGLLDELNISSS
ncbi:ABC transporter ATP-binding protein [Oceanobacillus zhaokaii]|uniref:ABC transporter ATP-binding protein n=1 Tax=Oceanobacillus zhaokaii TaxID=2052660 RepID=A0A345PKA4_9BACI|nr:ABC transporter ATP-binding protein [Oceanobacillus zhaokaii]AXI10434.1 ABC transporter ATP-binding protein [Oceanobacillus zhaokaii]